MLKRFLAAWLLLQALPAFSDTAGPVAATSNSASLTTPVENDWVNTGTSNPPTNIYVLSGSIAPDTSTGQLAYHFFGTFDFATAGLESGDTVTSVELLVRGFDSFAGDGGTCALNVYWSTDGTLEHDTVIAAGTATRIPSTGQFTGSAADYTNNIQGTTPTATQLLDADFVVLLDPSEDTDTFYQECRVEYLTLTATYTPAGGGSTASIPIIMHHREQQQD